MTLTPGPDLSILSPSQAGAGPGLTRSITTASICPVTRSRPITPGLPSRKARRSTQRNVIDVPARTGAWRVRSPVIVLPAARTDSPLTRRSATSQARLDSSHQGWVSPCEFSSPAEPVTSARPSSRCSWNRGTASASRLLKFGGHGLLPCCQNRFFELVKGDVCDAAGRREGASTAIDAIIHLAAIVGYPACKKEPQRRPGDQRRGHPHPAAAPQARPEGPLRLDRQHLRLDPRLRLQRGHPARPDHPLRRDQGRGRADGPRRRQRRRLPLRHRLRRQQPDAARPDAQRLHLPGRQEPQPDRLRGGLQADLRPRPRHGPLVHLRPGDAGTRSRTTSTTSATRA